MTKYISLKPTEKLIGPNILIYFRVKSDFDDVVGFKRGLFRVNTSRHFTIASCCCPEYRGAESSEFFIQGDTPSRDNDVLRCAVKDFVFLNTQVAVANALIKLGINESFVDDVPVAEDGYEPEYEDEDCHDYDDSWCDGF